MTEPSAKNALLSAIDQLERDNGLAIKAMGLAGFFRALKGFAANADARLLMLEGLSPAMIAEAEAIVARGQVDQR